MNKVSAAKLAELRDSGIKFVEVLGCNCPDEECDAYRAVKGMKMDIEFAQPLPLPGCDKKFCACIYLAVPG